MIGQTVSHYRITGKLGEGGMGVVYRADDQKLRRPVALKFLPKGLTPDPRTRQRLLHEARVASRLNHPNIATVYEVGESDDTPYIAMEFIEGQSLKDLLWGGALPASHLLAIARGIAEGLNEAHQAGVLHRDIKPGNIMIVGKKRAKILDFGLSVLTRRERSADETPDAFATSTQTQWSTGGTVAYMPPEQLRGEKIDARADIFSFGVLLYEAVSGTSPFRARSALATIRSICQDEPAPLTDLLPDIPQSFADAIKRLLRKAPDDRFQSAGEVAAALQATAAIDSESRASARGRLAIGGTIIGMLLIGLLGFVVQYWQVDTVDPRDGFFIVGSDSRYDTLADVIEASIDGDEIVVYGNRQYTTDPIRIDAKAITIRAGEGSLPTIRPLGHQPSSGPALRSNAQLTIEGLNFA